MALTITPTIQARINEQERSRHHRLLRRAEAMRLTYDRDYCKPDSCLLWQPDRQGRVELVTPEGCSCREFRVWGDCPHAAVVRERVRRS